MLDIRFKTENAAFADGDGIAETVRILKNITSKISAGQDSGNVIDVNGNKVGEWSLELPEETDADESEDQ